MTIYRESIRNKVFIHQKIPYAFNWNIENHRQKISPLNPYRTEFIRLGKYFNRIYQGKIPHNLFNTRALPRVSRFKIIGLKSMFLRNFGKNLIKEGKIEYCDSNSKLPQYAQIVHTNFKNNGIITNPGHGPVLKYILIKDRDSLAIEVPIWKKAEGKALTGHIDLIQIQDNVIKIIDYKPEGNFMFSLPQVATYGLLLKSVLKIENVKCVSFNKNNAWEFDPNILLTDVKDYLKMHNINERVWENYI
ncbi:MAG: hypothetical protein ACFFFB_03450 [Candidatus Heimdallarchaeota archaeon]